MRRYLRQVLIVFSGISLFFLFCFLGMLISIFFIQRVKDEGDILKSSVLEITLGETWVERETEPWSVKKLLADWQEERPSSLIDLLEGLEAAALDPKIVGISLRIDSPLGLSFSSLQEIRRSLLRFRGAAKWLRVYASHMTEGAYYLASVADDIMMPEHAYIEWNGLGTQSFFLGDLMKNWDVGVEVFRVGKYKNAPEIFERTAMSAEHKEQISFLLDDLYNDYLSRVAESRKIPVVQLRVWADSLLITNGRAAWTHGMIDRLGYETDYDSLLVQKMTEVDHLDEEDFHKTTWNDYQRILKQRKKTSDHLIKDKIAIVIAEGDIVDSDSRDYGEEIGSRRFSKIFKEIAEDEDIKGVVLRVNSPGGSFFASDLLWYEIRKLREKKSVVASMSGVAASGGYYLSMACDTILANSSTLTGSIGVFGIIFDLSQTSKNLGITFDQVGTNSHAHFPNPFIPLTPYQKERIQEEVDEIYDVFLSKLSLSRGRPKGELDVHASGRIWSGKQALERKLVDLEGGYTEAIEWVVQRENLENYRLVYFPQGGDVLENLLSSLRGSQTLESWLLEQYGPGDIDLKDSWKRLRDIEAKMNTYHGIQARMPMELRIR
ncbi:MAG: signal peptide peptidase SppA [Cytophagales bacterium]|nr:signal peptide peptidase SppA [Cytophagales bacterium]